MYVCMYIYIKQHRWVIKYLKFVHKICGVPRGWVGGFKPPEIPKALQNRAKLNPIVKTVKNC